MVTKRAYTPDRGDLVWLDLSPTRGHEQWGRRPALIISPVTYNMKSGLALTCPITSQVKGYPFEVDPKTRVVEGVLLVDQIRSVDWAKRGAEKIGTVSETVMAEIRDLLRKLIFE